MRVESVAQQSWRRLAACRGTPVDVFFDADVTLAAEICAGCMVRPDCATWALSDPQQLGFVGGLTEAERWATRRGKRTA